MTFTKANLQQLLQNTPFTLQDVISVFAVSFVKTSGSYYESIQQAPTDQQKIDLLNFVLNTFNQDSYQLSSQSYGEFIHHHQSEAARRSLQKEQEEAVEAQRKAVEVQRKKKQEEQDLQRQREEVLTKRQESLKQLLQIPHLLNSKDQTRLSQIRQAPAAQESAARRERGSLQRQDQMDEDVSLGKDDMATASGKRAYGLYKESEEELNKLVSKAQKTQKEVGNKICPVIKSFLSGLDTLSDTLVQEVRSFLCFTYVVESTNVTDPHEKFWELLRQCKKSDPRRSNGILIRLLHLVHLAETDIQRQHHTADQATEASRASLKELTEKIKNQLKVPEWRGYLESGKKLLTMIHAAGTPLILIFLSRYLSTSKDDLSHPFNWSTVVLTAFCRFLSTGKIDAPADLLEDAVEPFHAAATAGFIIIKGSLVGIHHLLVKGLQLQPNPLTPPYFLRGDTFGIATASRVLVTPANVVVQTTRGAATNAKKRLISLYYQSHPSLPNNFQDVGRSDAIPYGTTQAFDTSTLTAEYPPTPIDLNSEMFEDVFNTHFYSNDLDDAPEDLSEILTEVQTESHLLDLLPSGQRFTSAQLRERIVNPEM